MPSLNVASEITINLDRPNSNVVVYAKQYDMATRIIDINLMSGNVVWDPIDGCETVVMVQKPDGKKCIYDIVEGYPVYSNQETYEVGDRVIHQSKVWRCIYAIATPESWNSSHWALVSNVTPALSKLSTGKYRLTLAEQALTCAGNNFVEISFYTDTLRTTTLSFVVNVEKGVPNDEELASSDYFNVLSELIQGLLGSVAHSPMIDQDTNNWLLWDDTNQTYVDSGVSAIGPTGPAPIVRTTVRQYAASNSGTTPPGEGSWSANIPIVNPGQYLWTKTTINFVDANNDPVGSSITYSSTRYGVDGSGTPSDVDPLDLDSDADPGTDTHFSRADHVHSMTNIRPIGSKYYTISEYTVADMASMFGGTWELSDKYTSEVTDYDIDALYNGFDITEGQYYLGDTNNKLAANAATTISVTLSREDYIPIAVAGWGCSGSSQIMVVRSYINVDDTDPDNPVYTLSALVRNMAGTAIPTESNRTLYYVYKILWKKAPPANRSGIYCWTRIS